MKSLVAFFSAGGTTSGLAKKIAGMTGSDMFEIVPEQPYTPEDLDWTNPEARCNREFRSGADVPVSGIIQSLDEYELIFLGFPIWYECAPNIINTFCKAYDWTGKSVALFATSGGSEMGETEAKLMPFMPGAKIVHTQVMPGGGEPKASKETTGNKGGKKHKHGKHK